ncbi:MAG: hypothetical protein IIW27_00485 [Clostridia bacterium]|nr:hypothetical protein [Clostridia bacterium]
MTIAISAATALAVFLSVLIKPEVRIGKIKVGPYWIIALIGALCLLITGSLSLKTLFLGLTANTAVNPLKILVLFFSMTMLSVFLDETGFFRYLAGKVLSKAKTSQIKLFTALYVVVSVLTVFTSNDIIVLTFTPFICFFARRAGVSPMPYLFAEFVAANTWSMALVIGNPTNIYLASSAGIDFISYLAKMAIPTLLAGLTSYGLLVLLFRKQLKAPLVAGEASEERVENKIALILGVAHLALCTILLTVSSYLGWEMWLIAAGFALSLAACALVLAAAKKTPVCYLTGAVKRLPYELIPFVLSMFAIVLALNASGVTAQLGSLLAKLPQPFGYGVSSFLAANVINNIPMSVLFSDLLLAGGAEISAVYAAIIGSNLGAYFTPVGALAGIMWMTILKRFQVNLSFAKFIRYGVIISMPALAAALLGLVIVF